MANQPDEEYIEFMPTNEHIAKEQLSCEDVTIEIDMSSVSENDTSDDITTEIDMSELQANTPINLLTEETIAIPRESLPIPVADDSLKFQIHYSIIKEQSPVTIVFHCSGKITKSNCLILHNTFKMCSTKNLPFIIFDMSGVTAVDKEVWAYFSSKAIKLQKLNGILLFSGIRSEVLSETSDFHKLNICHCESIDTCCLAIRNLTQEYEKTVYFTEDTNESQADESEKSATVSNFISSEKSIVIEKNEIVSLENLQIDDSMSTDYSVGERTVTLNIDDSMSVDFSPNDNAMLTDTPTMSIDRDDLVLEDEDLSGESIINSDNTNDPYVNQYGIYGDGTYNSMADISKSEQKKEDVSLSIYDKIHLIITQNGPGSFLAIKKVLESSAFGGEKINSLNLLNVLKEMNLDTTKKRIRYYRSC